MGFCSALHYRYCLLPLSNTHRLKPVLLILSIGMEVRGGLRHDGAHGKVKSQEIIFPVCACCRWRAAAVRKWRKLIASYGGTGSCGAVDARSSLREQHCGLAFARTLAAGGFDMVIFLTGSRDARTGPRGGNRLSAGAIPRGTAQDRNCSSRAEAGRGAAGMECSGRRHRA